MASSTGSSIGNGSVELPPLRSLDDFALGSARFQLPNLKDTDKWGNRVVKNLLYYQTNYFLMFITIYVLMLILNPMKIACGLCVQAVLIAIMLHFFCGKTSSKTSFVASRLTGAKTNTPDNSQQKWYFLAGVLFFGYVLLHLLGAVLLTLFTLLLPVSLTFIHASLRLRNLKNKVANTMENFGPSTPMGTFLEALNITAESLLN